MKKEVSDHLARVFLETRKPQPPEEKKDSNERSFFFFVAISAAVIVSLILGLNYLSQSAMRRSKNHIQTVTLGKNDGPYSLKFNFTDSPSKVETLSIAMADMDLKGFTRMRFAIRLNQADAKNLGPIKVSLTNDRRESSGIYLSDIQNSWKTIQIPLRDFSKIYDWTHLVRLSFTLEAWNLTPKTGELLIDDVEFDKN